MKAENYRIIDFKDNIIEKKFKSKYNGEFIVIGATDIIISNHRLFLCKFLDTKSEGLFRKDKILSGEIKDRYKPTVHGVGYIGNIKTDKFLYPRWNKMIDRCYNPKNKDYKYYGGLGIKVSKEWLCFENFFNDAPNIQGYDYNKLINSEIEIDKDLCGEKLYSLETTRWLPTSINKYMGNQTQIKNLPIVIGIDKNDNYYEFQSMNKFSKLHNLHISAISRCVNGTQNQHKGWKFYYKK